MLATAAYILVPTFIVIFVSKWLFTYCPRIKLLPPGPKSLPLFGSLPFTPKSVRIGSKPLGSWMAEEYGPISCLDFTSANRSIFISDFQMIKELLRLWETSNRPLDPEPFPELRYGDCDRAQRGLLFSNGIEWLEQRKFTIKTLKKLGVENSNIMGNAISNDVDNLIAYLHPNVGKPTNLHLKFNLAVINALWSMIVGEELQLSDPRLHKIVEQYDNFMRSLCKPKWFEMLCLCIYPQSVKWFMPEFIIQHEVIEGIKVIVNAHICKHSLNDIDWNEPKDFIERYLQEVANCTDVNSSFFGQRGKESLIVVIMDLFMAGTETTSSSLLWAILCLLHYPDLQTRVQKELDTVVGEERRISLEDRPQLPFTNAVLAECMRMATIGPLAIPHAATEDIMFHGYLIPKGSEIHANILHVHFDPEYWSEPDSFDPLRFYDESTNAFMPNERLIPFSVGKRACLGQALAEKEYFLFLTGLLQKFTFKPVPGQSLPAIGKDAGLHTGLVKCVPDFECILENRI